VANLSVDTSFLVFPVIRFDVVLGRPWLKEYQDVHDHNLDCLYLGKESRRRVFSSAKRRGRNYLVATSLGKMSNSASVLSTYLPSRRLVARHVDIFGREDQGQMCGGNRSLGHSLNSRCLRRGKSLRSPW
jgi:hypothetical protein